MYKFNRISKNSYKELRLLFKSAFNLNMSLSSIENKYDTQLFGLSNVGLLAVDSVNTPAAYYGVFPIGLNYESKDHLIAQSGDTMTSPNHRKKGLFIKLAIETYKLSEELGIKMIFGFPNKNSYPGFKEKLNWVFCGNMQKFTINIMTIPFCELSSKFNILEPIYQWNIRWRIRKLSINPSEKNIECFNYSNVKGQIKKDVNFFTYKLRNKTCFLISYKGFTLLIKPKTHLHIGAVGYFDISQTKELIHIVKNLAKKLNCMQAIFTLSENHWLYEYMKKEITPSKSTPIGFFLYNDEIIPNEIQFTTADFDTF